MIKKQSSKKCQDHEGPSVASDNGFDVIDCQQCGFKHITPIPTVESWRGCISTIIINRKNRSILSVTERISTGGTWSTLGATKLLNSICLLISGTCLILAQAQGSSCSTARNGAGKSRELSHQSRLQSTAVNWGWMWRIYFSLNKRLLSWGLLMPST